MGSAMLRRLALTALVAGLAAGPAAGCAQERDEINRVQPLAIKKSDLVGDLQNPKDAPEFYMRSLIMEVQRTNPWFSDGLQDLTRRIRFEVTEDYLIARNGYEYIKNSDGKGGPRGKINNGPIVGKWAITSHFDIRKGYNPQTGELSNVIEENTTDRPWNEREFIRVDWSQNRADDPNQIFWYDEFGGDLKWGNVRYAESDKASEETRSDFSDLHKGYFDLTSRWVAGPQTLDYYGYALPACFLRNYNLSQGTYTADPSIECNDQEVTLRTSFWKVPVGEKSTDYEVAEVTQWQGNIMGNLVMDRSGYDRNYGIVDDTWHTYIMRYNMWRKSHLANDCGNEAERTQAAADATCAGVNVNSYCDLNAGKCAMPYKDRTVRPVAFFVDPAMPAAMYPSTAKSIKEWNTALSRAASYARESECRKAASAEGKGDINDDAVRSECHRQYFEGDIDLTKEDVPKLLADRGETAAVVMCHNPVENGDDKECGPVGKRVRKGDIREHMIAWWNNPSFERPLGVIVWSGDPISGENIGSTVNIFGASVETYSARARDQIMLINGDVSPSEYAAGVMQQWYANEPGKFDNDPKVSPELDALAVKFKNGAKAELTPAQAKERLEAVGPQIAALSSQMGFQAALAKAKNPAERRVAYDGFVAQQSKQGAQGFATRDEHDAKLAARMQKLRTGGFEPKMMNDLWLSSAGIDPQYADNADVKKYMSPLDGMSAPTMARLEQTEMERRKLMHMCKLQGPEMLTFNWMSGYSAKMKARYPDGQTATGDVAKLAGVEGQTIDRIVRGKLIFQELLAPIYEFTLLHEMGHLMSMEHDFSGSWDSPNFEPEYWILRANGKKSNSVACPPTGRAKGSPDTCMGPRWLDPVTTDELGTTPGKEHDSADSYSSSSVMDYKFDSIYSAKLGPMDKMAAKFIYTRMVELVDDEKYSLVPAAVAKRILPTNTLMNASEWYVSPGGVGDNEFIKHYTSLGQMMNIFDERRCRPQTEEEARNGTGQLGMVCALPHKDHAFLRDTAAELPAGGFPEDFRVQYGKQTGTTSAKYRWPYKVSNGQLAYFHNYFYDNGADMYEVTTDILERYELMYLDYFYRKNARERNVGNAGRSMFGRFFDRIQALQWNCLSDVVRSGGLNTGTSYGDQANELSLTLMFDAMAASLLRPQPGAYVKNNQPGQLFDLYSNPETPASNPVFSLGAGDARYVDYQFDLTKQFDYRAYAFRSGSFLEKPYASIALTDARPQLSTVARETYLDGRNVMFSFRSAIPQGFDRLIAGIMADDYDTVAPYVDINDQPDSSGMRPIKTMQLWQTDAAKLTRPASARLVDPVLGFRVKVPTMVLMMLYQPIDSNMELIQRTRIWVTGGQEQIRIPDTEKVTFFDPIEGNEWNSRTFGTETIATKLVDKGIGARMIQHANELLLAAYNVDSEAVPGGAAGQLRPKYLNGRPVKAGVPITSADVKDAVAVEKLRTYVAFLNQVRSALYYLGFSPCANGEACN